MKESELRLLDRITDAFVALDEHWRFVFVNPQAAELLGRERLTLLGRGIWDEFPALVGEPFHAACLQAMAQQVPTQIEGYSARLGRWIENRIYPAAEGMTILFTDISQRKAREASLRQYQDIFRLAEIGLVIGTGDGATLGMMNPAFARMHGYEAEELQGRPVGDVYAPEARGKLPSHIRRTEERGHNVYESLHLHRDGTTFPVSVDTTAVKDGEGHVLYRIVNVTDTSERLQAEGALRAAAFRLEALIGNIQAGVIVEDEAGQVVLANQKFCDLMGLAVPPTALTGVNVIPMARGTSLLFADPDGFIECALDLRRRGQAVSAEELRLKDGRVWERDYVPVLPGGDGTAHSGHLWMFRDVTARHRAEQKLAEYSALLERQNAELAALATTDGLTHLLNHRVFEQRLSEEFLRARRYSEPLCLIVLDVDRFKAYNDSFGHLSGNEVLRKLAEVLREHARETDLVARFGGEEFALILPHTEAGDAAALAERLRSALQGTVWSAQYPITASFGVCLLTPEMEGPDALVACADAAMYRAKAGGRNRVEWV